MKPPAFKATYSDLKIIKTRQTVQIILELPIGDFDIAYEILGGLPNPNSERWVAVAVITPPIGEPEAKTEREGILWNKTAMLHQPEAAPPAGIRRKWEDLSATQQAGIRCAEPRFAEFLADQYASEWDADADAAACVREICHVSSRRELVFEPPLSRWQALEKDYQAWLLKGRAYGEWCRDPGACKGKGYCPLDPTCGD